MREFDRKPSPTHLNSFFKKILADAEYRKQFLNEGEWKETIEWKELVNPRTKAIVEQINALSMGRLKFKDFKNLKVDGIDGYSRMKKEKLEVIITKEDSERVDDEFEEERLRLSVKRWVARGLEIEKAIRKIKTDEEVRMNTEKSKRY
ncbi:MAG: hypothetical protein KAU62_16260 [Candidatus Heimdallarchaeota archaeon]|nr:hypothetical protein [Candidatus Heimdallarchaeota archaeon]MCG3257658.1 hypothetical protein [Candidatus Heimdallarchaeota archaeon]MCK4612710.1 hypothetical protein [Candidatus Heimdallarchaeota archaeon]